MEKGEWRSRGDDLNEVLLRSGEEKGGKKRGGGESEGVRSLGVFREDEPQEVQ